MIAVSLMCYNIFNIDGHCGIIWLGAAAQSEDEEESCGYRTKEK